MKNYFEDYGLPMLEIVNFQDRFGHIEGYDFNIGLLNHKIEECIKSKDVKMLSYYLNEFSLCIGKPTEARFIDKKFHEFMDEHVLYVQQMDNFLNNSFSNFCSLSCPVIELFKKILGLEIDLLIKDIHKDVRELLIHLIVKHYKAVLFDYEYVTISRTTRESIDASFKKIIINNCISVTTEEIIKNFDFLLVAIHGAISETSRTKSRVLTDARPEISILHHYKFNVTMTSFRHIAHIKCGELPKIWHVSKAAGFDPNECGLWDDKIEKIFDSTYLITWHTSNKE